MLRNWHKIVDQVSKADPLSRRYLLDTAPLRTDETYLVVGFDPEFSSELKRFDDSRTKLSLGRAVEKVVGRLLSISFEPLKSDDRRPLPADNPVSESSADNTVELSGVMKWYANPVVKTVVDAFNSEITDIRE